ncbi:MAG: glycosyltransferase family 2 protein, partial [Solirubrobacteraceae bacterium]
MSPITTVALPIRNAGSGLTEVLRAVAAQRVPGGLEVLVCDSGSTDGSAELAERLGATVIRIAPAQFSHGGTRNLLMERAQGEHVAFLTQDAVPADEGWLGRLLGAFALAPDVGLAFGPYRPRPQASPMVARELTAWFAAFAPDGRTRVDRLDEGERDLPARALLGPRGFFTDANGCVSRAAWERVGFQAVPHSEDHALAHDMLRAGFAKVFMPEAAVIHSHDYSTWGWLQRSFDEARALHDLYGWRAPADPRTLALNVWGRVGADRRWARGNGAAAGPELLARAAAYHV